MMAAISGVPVYLLNVGGDAQRLDEVEQKIKPSIPDLTRINGIEQVQRSAGQAGIRAFVLVVAPSTAPEDFTKLIDIVARHRGNVFYILISGEISGSDYKLLLQSGNADWVQESRPAQEILDIIARQRANAAIEPAETNHPLVISFVPSAGGVGNTTLAIETGVQLSRVKGTKEGGVCLVDLDFQTSHVCDHLDMEPRLQIGEIVGAPERLDDQLLEIFASRHSSGLHVFAAPRNRFQYSDLDIGVLDALFARIAQRYQYILIDMPVIWRIWTVHVIGASQGVLVTGVNSIPGLRQISETLAAIRGADGVVPEIRVVLNRCRFNLVGGLAQRGHVASVLGEEKPFLVRDTPIALECANTGKAMTLAHPSSKVVRDVGAIAKFCVGLKKARVPALTRRRPEASNG